MDFTTAEMEDYQKLKAYLSQYKENAPILVNNVGMAMYNVRS